MRVGVLMLPADPWPDAVRRAQELEAMGYETVCWRAHNTSFCGASVVARSEKGELEAAGDPRRGGAGAVSA